MQNFSVKQLITVFVVAMLVLAAALAGSAVYELERVAQQVKYDHQVAETVVKNLALTKYYTIQIQQYLTDSAATGETDGIDDANKNRLLALQTMQQLRGADKGLAGPVRALEESIAQLYATGLRMVAAYSQSRDAGNAIMKGQGGFDQQSDNTVAALDTLSTQVGVIQAGATRELNRTTQFAQRLVAGLSLMLGGLICLAGILIYRKLIWILGAEPATSRQFARQLSDGDLSAQAPLAPRDTQSVLYCLFAMRDQWSRVIASLRGKASQMISAAQVLTTIAQRLVLNNDKQNQATQALAAHVQQLSAQMDVISQRAQQTGEELFRTQGQASDSAGVIAQVV